ncbi:MAG: hypothetical protein R3E79_15520 [Caldilineaceae bacterium]
MKLPTIYPCRVSTIKSRIRLGVEKLERLLVATGLRRGDLP